MSADINFKIRIMRSDDYSEVYKLWLSCKGMGLNDLDDSKEGIDRYLSRNPDTCFIAEVEGNIAGVIMAGHDGRRGYIHHTAVCEKYRKCGIGHSLVDAAMAALKSHGIRKVALVVFEKNEVGNEFWEKLGFTTRNDLVYRNKCICEMRRIDT